MAASDQLVFLPLGGSGEIGMNLNLYGFGPAHDRRWIMVDLGVTFGDEKTPGVDLICPDTTFIEQERDNLLALILTHAHEDHIGATALLWPRLECPIYATPFTAALVRRKFEEEGIANPPINIIAQKARFVIGPFDIEYVTLTHSIPEPNGLAIRTRLGTVLHTGDWKLDPTPVIGERADDETLIALGDDGVLAMTCDSTNVFSPGESGSELDVRNSLIEVLKEFDGRIAVTTFASNVSRLESVLIAAREAGRHVALLGMSMRRIVEIAREVGMLKNLPALVEPEEAGYLPPENVLFLCTGSQGERRAALSRIAAGDHPHVVLEEGDAVIFSSRVIPGNETEIFALQNALSQRGVQIITEKDHFIHVSGHPCRDELARMYEWVRPEISIPVHGEARHLAEHARYARELGVKTAIAAENGVMIQLAPGAPEIIDEVPAGRFYLDGSVLVGDADNVIPQRKKLAFAGHVTIALALDDDDRLIGAVEARLRGVPPSLRFDGEPVETIIEERIEEALERLSRGRRGEEAIETLARRIARRVLSECWRKKPEVSVAIVRV